MLEVEHTAAEDRLAVLRHHRVVFGLTSLEDQEYQGILTTLKAHREECTADSRCWTSKSWRVFCAAARWLAGPL